MSLPAFLVGIAAGGARYGVVKYKLHERESVVFYAVDQIKESLQGRSGRRLRLDDAQHPHLQSREHGIYTYIREGWNAGVLGFRDGMMELFSTKK